MKVYTLNTINIEDVANSSVSAYQTFDEAVKNIIEAIKADWQVNVLGKSIEARITMEVKKYGKYYDQDNRLYMVKEHTL